MGMRTALKNFADEGKDASVAMDEVVGRIANMADETAATDLAIKTFGSRAGAELAFAIRKGKFEIEDWVSAIASADGTLSKTADAASTMEGRWTKASNSINAAFSEALSPEVNKLSMLFADLVYEVGGFLRQNPALVKAVSIFAGILGGVTIALGAYAVAAKVAAAASALLSAAIPGLNIIMGVTAAVAGLTAVFIGLSGAFKEANDEALCLTATSKEQYYQMKDLEGAYETVKSEMGDTSAEAQILKQELDDATRAFEENKQTAEEAAEAHREFVESYAEFRRSQAETITGAKDEGESIVNLTSKLRDLMGVKEKTAAQDQQILSLVELLNQKMPELGLAYDQYSHTLNKNITDVKKLAEAESARRRNAANFEALIKFQEKQAELDQKAEETLARKTAAEKQLASVVKERKQAEEDAAWGGNTVALEETFSSASKEAKEANAQYEEQTSLVKENQREMDALSDAVSGYTDAQGNMIPGLKEMDAATGSLKTQMRELAEAYTEAYNAALTSVQGQYKLWEEAAEVTATSAGSINKALESQAQYWKDYNENLDGLTNRAQNIEGLDEMMAGFSDGSKESVNAIAGMATASDTELKKMVQNWKEVQEEQKGVSGSMAELRTNFTEEMTALKTEFEDTVKGMDMGEQAAESGKNTIQGFVDGAEDMLPEVDAAYRKIAKAAKKAIDEEMKIESPSREMFMRGEMTMAGFTGGVESMEPEVAAAMADAANSGMDAVDAEQTQIVALAPQFVAALSAMNAGTVANTVTADPGSRADTGSAAPIINFNPTFHIDAAVIGDKGALRETISQISEEMRDDFKEMMDDYFMEKARRAYE